MLKWQVNATNKKQFDRSLPSLCCAKSTCIKLKKSDKNTFSPLNVNGLTGRFLIAGVGIAHNYYNFNFPFWASFHEFITRANQSMKMRIRHWWKCIRWKTCACHQNFMTMASVCAINICLICVFQPKNKLEKYRKSNKMLHYLCGNVFDWRMVTIYFVLNTNSIIQMIVTRAKFHTEI